MSKCAQAREARLKQAERGVKELQAALEAAQQDAVEAATSAQLAEKELRAQQSMSAQHQRLLRQLPPRLGMMRSHEPPLILSVALVSSSKWQHCFKDGTHVCTLIPIHEYWPSLTAGTHVLAILHCSFSANVHSRMAALLRRWQACAYVPLIREYWPSHRAGTHVVAILQCSPCAHVQARGRGA